jgi:hypothetical protein
MSGFKRSFTGGRSQQAVYSNTGSEAKHAVGRYRSSWNRQGSSRALECHLQGMATECSSTRFTQWFVRQVSPYGQEIAIDTHELSLLCEPGEETPVPGEPAPISLA